MNRYLVQKCNLYNDHCKQIRTIPLCLCHGQIQAQHLCDSWRTVAQRSNYMTTHSHVLYTTTSCLSFSNWKKMLQLEEIPSFMITISSDNSL